MSFEGYYQWIDTDGQLRFDDVYSSEVPNYRTKYWRIVDLTNGINPDDPSTYDAPVEHYCSDWCMGYEVKYYKPEDMSLWHEVKDG